MEALNHALFLWINATDPSGFGLAVGRLLASYVVYLFPLYLAVNWLRADAAGREALLQAALSLVVALVLSWIVSRLWFTPRPFVLGLGQQHMAHKPTASFPSNHLSGIWAICAGLWLHSVRRRTAVVLALLGLPVAWARIYMGIHFPLDMLGAAANAVVAAAITWPLKPTLVPRLRAMLEPVYRALFAGVIRRGWARA